MAENDEAMRRHIRFMNARNSPLQSLMTLLIVGILFMFFQATIMKNLSRTQMMLLNSGSQSHNKAKYVHVVKYGSQNPEYHRINPKFASKLKKEIGMKVNGTLLRGVKKDFRKFYVPNENGEFVCLSGNQTIEWSFVNNDYCDCKDGSDEPGTSACPNGRFFCEPELRYFSSSRVNDGICDCCDGSDEWKGVTADPSLNLTSSESVNRAPCQDTCADYKHQQVRQQNEIKEGLAAKEIIIKQSEQFATNQMFGSQGEFYYLSINCFTYKSPGYVYEICPFVNATQNGQESWLIGKGGVLKPDENQIVMDNGDHDHCPDGKPRKSIVGVSRR